MRTYLPRPENPINLPWEHGGADFQSRFDKSTGQAQEMREGALRVGRYSLWCIRPVFSGKGWAFPSLLPYLEFNA